MDNINDAFEDDLEVVELLEEGIPREIYFRSNYFDDLSDLKFFQRFRLRKETVLNLLVNIEGQLEFLTDRNNAVSSINQLLTTLRVFATGGHLSTIADYMGMHTATASRIVKRVSEAIAGLYDQYITMPQNEYDIRRAQNDFYAVARFPRIIGALDCTHVKIESPGGENAEVFRNRKDYFSVNDQAMCNANMEFTNVVARWPESAHDVTIFNNSRLRHSFEAGEYPNSIILGDNGYNIRTYLFTPLLNPQGNNEQLYNEAHIRTRNVIERTFATWKRRFPILAYGCRLQIETTIIACAVLHNIARKMGEEDPPLPEDVDQHELQQLIENGDIPAIPLGNNAHRHMGAQYRLHFINNFFGNL